MTEHLEKGRAEADVVGPYRSPAPDTGRRCEERRRGARRHHLIDAALCATCISEQGFGTRPPTPPLHDGLERGLLPRSAALSVRLRLFYCAFSAAAL